MKLVIGLGNPGLEYKSTRHNIGFMFLDFLVNKYSFEDFKDSKFKGLTSEGTIDGEKVILLKPMTYMNLSGESIISLINFYKIKAGDFIVIFDDVSMAFGKIRYRNDGRDGGHNGIKSLINCFGIEQFARIKIGIGTDPKYDLSDWVLSKFSNEELKKLENEIFENTNELLLEKFFENK